MAMGKTSGTGAIPEFGKRNRAIGGENNVQAAFAVGANADNAHACAHYRIRERCDQRPSFFPWR